MSSPQREKIFLEQLVHKKNLPFTQVIALLTDPKDKDPTQKVSESLNFLWNEDLFVFKKIGSDEPLWFTDDKAFSEPDNYYIEFGGIDSKESLLSSPFQGKICLDDIQPRSEHHAWVGIKQREWLTIIGEQKTATTLAERIRAFTQLFAFHIATRNYKKAEDFVACQLKNKYSAEFFEKKIQDLEKQLGHFEFFDHINVTTVYNGKNNHISASGEMKLPEGFSKEQRRGDAEFHLISVYTPNGIEIYKCTLKLSIIQENHLFKICDLMFHTR